MVSRWILIVEDDADVRESLADALRSSGLLVEVARDGLDALELLRGGLRPAVILLDLRMPRLCGEDFLRAIRADPALHHLPVITMTAEHGAARDGDVVAHLHKPFDIDDLLAIVLSLCEADAA